MWIRRVLLGSLLLLALLLGGPFLAAVTGIADVSGDWSRASRTPAGLAPDPKATPTAVVQVYGARAFGWRGAFAVHTWIAVKRPRDLAFTTHEVIGWRFWRGGTAVVSGTGAPDRHWFGAKPKLYLDLRGPEAEALIDRIETAVESYPFKNSYRSWPGPNSNTFTAWIARKVPELGLELPPTAVGKDYLGATRFAAVSPSGTGVQISLLGLLGGLAAWEEGLELHLLGLTLGVDPMDLGIKLPGLGRLAPQATKGLDGPAAG
ncbi:MAG: DUF3750 domain-containing protein [Kiloniellales bacterium]|nr:DUF3750 domain-containing protein [Kiloniellales bacterium]